MGARTSVFNSTTGGVMTVEAGAVTGELELSTSSAGGGAIEAKVRYKGADEWYTVEGSPANTTLAEEGCHDRIVGILTTPGEKEGFNESPVSLPGEIA